MRIFLLFVTLIIINPVLHAEEKKAYFAGGCFWCMEESFDQVEGVISTISGYSGGHLKNPKYADVIYTDSGHVEAIEVTYDTAKIDYQKLLDVYWKNIDPFDANGQFCDKGKSYRSVIFFENEKQKELIDNSFRKLINSCLDENIISIDTEFVRNKTFYPQLCLLQIGTSTGSYAIDPNKISNLPLIKKILRNKNILKIFHSPKQDIELSLIHI